MLSYWTESPPHLTLNNGAGDARQVNAPHQHVDNRSNYNVPPRFRKKHEQERHLQITVQQQVPPTRTSNPSEPYAQSVPAASRVSHSDPQPMSSALSPYHTLLKDRVAQILRKKNNGLWDMVLPKEYANSFGEEAPPNLISLIEGWTDIVTMESVQGTDKKILYPVIQSDIRIVQSQAPEEVHIPPALQPIAGTKLEAYTCNVVDPHHMYLHRANSDVFELEKQLKETYDSRGSPKELSSAKAGTFCVAKYDNEAWYRAQIVTASKRNGKVYYEVFYVDYGNTEEVGSMRARRLLTNYTTMPAQALKCRMANVFPKGVKWTSEDVAAFGKIYDFNKEILVQVINVEGDCCEIVIYDGQDMSVCLNEVMVRKGIALGQALPPEPEEISLPDGDEWEIFVSCIESGCEVIVRLIGEDYSRKLEKLESSLAELDKLVVPPEKWKVDVAVAVSIVEDGDTCWYRCRVLELVPHTNRARVYFLDHGDSEVVDVSSVRELPPRYNQLPYQAVRCKLSGLEPYAEDERLLTELRKTVLGKTFWCEVNERVECFKVTLVDTSADEDENINTKISHVLLVQDLAPKLPALFDTIEGFVSHVAEQGKVFFTIQGPGLQKLEEMHEEIDRIYATVDPSLFMRVPEVGCECVAKYSEGGQEGWFRAVIHQLYPSMRKAAVYFVDYGNSEIVSYANLRVYSAESKLLKMLPFQAIECELDQLPPEGGEWSEAVYNRIREICPANELRVLEMVVRPENECPIVEFYRENKNQEQIGLSEILLAEHLFFPSRNDPQRAEAITISDDEDRPHAVRPAADIYDTSPRSIPPRHSALLTAGNTGASLLDTPLAQGPLSSSPLRVDIAAAQQYSAGRQAAPSPGTQPPLSKASSTSTLPSLSPGSPIGMWGDEVSTPDLRSPESWAALSPKAKKSPDLDGLHYSPISPTDKRKMVEYEDVMASPEESLLEEAEEGPPLPRSASHDSFSDKRSTPDKTSPAHAARPIKGILKNRSTESFEEAESLEISIIGGDDLLHEEPPNNDQPTTSHEPCDSSDPIIDLDESDDSDSESNLSNASKSEPAPPPLKKNVSFSEQLTMVAAVERLSVSESVDSEEPENAEGEQAENAEYEPPPLDMPKSGDSVFVTWVENPHNFRCIPQTTMEELRDQTDDMLVYYNQHQESHKVVLQEIEEGKLYAGIHQDLWYRVIVKKLIFNQVAIHFVDFGDHTFLPFSSLRTLVPNFRSLPFQAIRAKLAGVESSEEHWSEEARERINELIHERTLTAFIHASEAEFLSVTLVDTTKSDDEQFIHKVLLKEGLARKPEPFPKSPVKDDPSTP